MLIAGNWRSCDDGISRPMIRADVHGNDSVPLTEWLLVDSGADKTVFSAALLLRLGLPFRPGPAELSLSGVGGHSGYVVVDTALVLAREDAGIVKIQGEFPAFTDPEASDFSVLGRDVLERFDLIVSRRRNEIVLLGGPHRYRVETV